MNMNRLFPIILTLIIIACSSDPAATPEQVSQPRTTPSATVTAVPEPTTTATPQPTNSPMPQPTDTPAPTATSTVDINTLQIIEPQKLNLNSTTQYALLETIPDLDQQLAIEFFENQPYSSIEQFRTAIGELVEPSQLRGFEQYVYVPININESDAETLMQMPGVTMEVADALIEKRPFTTSGDFLTVLLPYLTEAQLRIAGGLIE